MGLSLNLLPSICRRYPGEINNLHRLDHPDKFFRPHESQWTKYNRWRDGKMQEKKRNNYVMSRSKYKICELNREVKYWGDWQTAYQIKSTESPATSLLALTNTLHPVVRRCLLGWPA